MTSISATHVSIGLTRLFLFLIRAFIYLKCHSLGILFLFLACKNIVVKKKEITLNQKSLKVLVGNLIGLHRILILKMQ